MRRVRRAARATSDSARTRYTKGVLYWLAGLLLSVHVALAAAPSAAQLGAEIREVGLDPAQCYRVRELNFDREDLHVYLTDGYLIFARPVRGVRLVAVFTSDVEAGDAEVMLLPPLRSERASMAEFTGSPNLDEHLKSALMLFSDGTAEQLLEMIHNRGAEQKNPEMGALVASQWTPVVRNLAENFEVRLVEDLLTPGSASSGIFFMAVAGDQLGNFDLFYDPRSRQQILAGQLTEHEGRPAYDIWATFESRSVRSGQRKVLDLGYDIRSYRIEATLDSDLHLACVTHAQLEVGDKALPVLLMQVSPRMRVEEVRVDGEPAEVFARESLRSSALQSSSSASFLVVPAHPLQPGGGHTLDIRHSGDVIRVAGNHVYFVGSRSSWYPHGGLDFATYDLTFRYPKTLSLVTAGDIVEDRTDGDWRVTRRRITTPVRLAGFNLGMYEQSTATKAGFTVEVYGNRRVEAALERPHEVIVLPPPQIHPSRTARTPVIITTPAPPPDPTARLKFLANDVASALEFMAGWLGPPALNTLTVSPIPGTFGQGFPGLVYLSTLTYLPPQERPAGVRERHHQLFFSDLLQAHETAHQWFGNLVTVSSYQDEWLMEALANYTALLYLEKKKGHHALETVLDNYRDDLLERSPDGGTVESSGPITWGNRLESSRGTEVWRTITYEKGSWIIHMLRVGMGDQRFLQFLGQLCRRYRTLPISTEGFRRLASEFLPPHSSDPDLETFFDNWVYGTGIPSLKLSYSVKGKAPALHISGTVRQGEVPDDFSASVPIDIQFARGAPQRVWVYTSEEPATFSVRAREAPKSVVIAPLAVLSTRR